MADGTDALAPLVALQGLMTDWDAQRSANRLAEDGDTRVHAVIDGLEGDPSPEGRRTVNGWKNAGLPWRYRLDKARMYFPR